MKTLINVLFVLLVSACGPEIINPPTDAQCVGPVLVENYRATYCPGPSGCMNNSISGPQCDQAHSTPVGGRCTIEGQLWCHDYGTSLIVCVKGVWNLHLHCAGGCANNPVRCF